MEKKLTHEEIRTVVNSKRPAEVMVWLDQNSPTRYARGIDWSAPDEFGLTLAAAATFTGASDVLRELRHRDVDLWERNPRGETLAHVAAEFDSTLRYTLYAGDVLKISKTNTDVLEQLLDDDRANVDAQDSVLETPAHKAATAGNIRSLELLISHGADIYLTDIDGNDVRDVAKWCGCENGCINLIDRYIWADIMLSTLLSRRLNVAVDGGSWGWLIKRLEPWSLHVMDCIGQEL